MPKETDERRLRILREAFSDPASNVPEFTETALDGGYRSDEGLDTLLPTGSTQGGKVAQLKQAVVELLESGGVPNIEVAPGDAQMELDAGLFYHFRISVEGVRLFVKVLLDEDDPGEPEVKVISVKRDDTAWE